MPSPFPGMDPYLEASDFWQGFQQRVAIYIADDLQPRLPDEYVTTIEVREYYEWTSTAHRDVGRSLVENTPVRSAAVDPSNPEEALVPGASGYWVPGDGTERRERSLAIRTGKDLQLVTWIELLSPANKRPGVGRRQYQEKQVEVLAAGLNLVELDLLRGGAHTVAVDAAWLRADQPRDYIACKHLSTRAGWFWVRQWSVRDPLPVIEIPLAAGEAAVPLDLGELFTRAHENGRFDRLIRYDADPEPPLSTEDAVWADGLLRVAGLREMVDA